MGNLLYVTLASLDGYIEDQHGDFQWAAPDEEVSLFVNDLIRPIGTYLYGRRIYETMVYWETVTDDGDSSPVELEFAAMWRAADKVVFSTSLEAVSSARTRLEQSFDPEAIRAMKTTCEGDLSVNGPTLAAHAFRAGLVDEVHLFVKPTIVGGGKPALPAGLHLDLELRSEQRFKSGFVHLGYQVTTPESLGS